MDVKSLETLSHDSIFYSLEFLGSEEDNVVFSLLLTSKSMYESIHSGRCVRHVRFLFATRTSRIGQEWKKYPFVRNIVLGKRIHDSDLEWAYQNDIFPNLQGVDINQSKNLQYDRKPLLILFALTYWKLKELWNVSGSANRSFSKDKSIIFDDCLLRFDELETLQVDWSTHQISNKVFSGLTKLKHLEFEYGYGKEKKDIFEGLKTCSLEYLRLKNVDDKLLKGLETLPVSIKEFSFRGRFKGQVLKRLTNLEKLTLLWSSLDKDHFEAIEKNVKLKTLTLENYSADDCKTAEKLMELFEKHFQNITCLRLNICEGLQSDAYGSGRTPDESTKLNEGLFTKEKFPNLKFIEVTTKLTEIEREEEKKRLEKEMKEEWVKRKFNCLVCQKQDSMIYTEEKYLQSKMSDYQRNKKLEFFVCSKCSYSNFDEYQPMASRPCGRCVHCRHGHGCHRKKLYYKPMTQVAPKTFHFQCGECKKSLCKKCYLEMM